MPRPPDSTISASVSSGSPVETSSRRSTNLICAAAVAAVGRSTVAVRPGRASAGRKTFGRSVATQGVFAHVTLARSLPAYTGRVATSRSPSIANATQSAASPTPSRAASRATNSRARLVTGAKMAFGRSLAQRPDELLHRRRHVALEDAPGRTGRGRLERDDGELRRLRGPPEVGRLHVADLLLLRPHDASERRIPRLVEPFLRREDGGQRQVEDLQPALDLVRGPHRLAVSVDRLLHDPRRARPSEQLREPRRHGPHVLVHRLPAAPAGL